MSTVSPLGDKEVSGALATAAYAALDAPSVFNTQPWRWRLRGDLLELRADRSRRLVTADPAGRLLVISCGVALHHARTALAAAGFQAEVDRLPEPDDDSLLARIRTTGAHLPSPAELASRDAMPRRRTDRRAYGERPVPAAALDRLRAAAEAEGAHLHLVRPDQMPMLAIAVMRAGIAELADPGYRVELMSWTNRPQWSGDGVPAGTSVRPAPRRVPVRTFTLDPQAGLPAGPGGDRGARYLVLYGTGDDPSVWLRAGEALSAVLLTATADALSTAAISDVVEVAETCELLGGLLPGDGHPFVVVRVGYGQDPATLPPTPRRSPAEVVDDDGPAPADAR